MNAFGKGGCMERGASFTGRKKQSSDEEFTLNWCEFALLCSKTRSFGEQGAGWLNFNLI